MLIAESSESYFFHYGSTAKATARKGVSACGIAAGLAPAPAKPIMTFGAVCRASMRAVMRNLASIPGLSLLPQ